MEILTDAEVREWFAREVPTAEFNGQRVLVIIPDATRTAPLPLLFSALHDRIGATAKQVDVLVALGTHPPMPELAIAKMLGMSDADRTAGTLTRSASEVGTLTRSASEGGTLTRSASFEVAQFVVRFT